MTADPDIEVEARAAAEELRFRRRGKVRVVAVGDAQLVAEGERRNLPPDPQTAEPYRGVRARSRHSASLRRS